LQRRLVEAIDAIPGVEDVAFAQLLPMKGCCWPANIFPDSGPVQSDPSSRTSLMAVSESYFRTMRIPLKRGRLFDARDGKDAKPVVLINETFARKYFPNENPLGQRVQIGRREDGPPREIVGVVGTAKHGHLAEADEAEYYLPFAQAPDRYSDIVVRTSEPPPASLETMIRRAVHEIDAQQFIPTLKPLPELVSATLSQSRDDQNQGVSFRVLDPAQRPESPNGPNRFIFNTLVLIFGVGGGIGIALLPVLLAGHFLHSDELANQFGVPVIGVISALPFNVVSRRSRLSTVALSVTLGLLFVSYVAVIALLQTSIFSVLGV
jgi:hypothetical protein